MPITGFSSNITELESSLNKTLENIENKRKEFNKAVDEKENNKIQLDNLNLKISWYEIKDNYQSFQLQEKEYKKILDAIKKNKEDLRNTSNEITRLQSDKQNVKIANDKINLFLEYIMNDKGLSEVLGICIKENIASCKVLEKCGFELFFSGVGSYQGEKKEICKYIYRR